MSHADDVIHQWGPRLLGQGAAGSLSGEEGAERQMWWGVEWNGWDNDQAVGFGDGSTYVSGGYDCS